MAALYRFYHSASGEWKASLNKLRGSHFSISNRYKSSKGSHSYLYHFCGYIGEKIAKKMEKSGKDSELLSININNGEEIRDLISGSMSHRNQVRRTAMGFICGGIIYHIRKSKSIYDFKIHVNFMLAIYKNEVKIAVCFHHNKEKMDAIFSLLKETDPLFITCNKGEVKYKWR